MAPKTKTIFSMLNLLLGLVDLLGEYVTLLSLIENRQLRLVNRNLNQKNLHNPLNLHDQL